MLPLQTFEVKHFHESPATIRDLSAGGIFGIKDEPYDGR